MSFFNEAAVTLKLIKESFELGRTLQLAAESCQKWIAENDTDMQTRGALLDKARDNAIEALHLFSTKGLDERAETCRDLVRRLEDRIDRSCSGHRYRKIRFDGKWLIEDRIVAASDSMKMAISRVRKLAPGQMPVLVSGETGTGKEIIAGLLHRFSNRSEGPFVPVNCAAIPDTIFESELFGYRKGAFTGASRDKAGLFEEASGGTLFLDEITELTARQQAKLLRALQEQRVRRVGETKERPVDVRLVSASNQDVWSMVESGRLREDFYYRVAGGVIELEPLRNRKDDIIPLFSYFLCGSNGGFDVEEGLTELLRQYHWPGNVRELINITEELALLGQSGQVARKRDLPLIIRSFILSEPRDTDDLHRQIEIGLLKHNGNKTAVARELGIGRSTLYRHLEELEIN
jgi:transcriptional regulator with PAS, ATPase and Fis domain